MIAPPQQMKTCGSCYRLLPAEAFHFANKPAKKRHTVCPKCRRQHEQDRRRASRQKVLGRELRLIRRTESAENLWNLVMNLCSQVGGLSNVLKLLRDRILDEQTSSACRCSATRALLHMMIVSDKEHMRLRELEIQQLQDELKQDRLEEANWERSRELYGRETADEAIRMLHAAGELVPALSRMLDNGSLTLADFDPPPCDTGPMN